MPVLLYWDGFRLSFVTTADLSHFQGHGETSRVQNWHGTYLLADDVCYDKGRTPRLRRCLTNAMIGPKTVNIPILMYTSFASIAAIPGYAAVRQGAPYYSPVDFRRGVKKILE